ncbi:MAG: RnfABCDGE type electron transport complex subunit D [Eubacteriales bacterium]|nr:RnfABCDGE type electron transport complex subunit D [Eubacteriales bacterium]
MSASPHAHSHFATPRMMQDVIIAMTPAMIAAFLLFGWRSILVTAVSVISCVFFEWLVRRILKRPCSLNDYSAVVTGILLAFNLPVSIPIWMIVFGAAVAIIVVKQFFGGIGQNFVNPALMGRIVLLSSFPTQMATWTESGLWQHLNPANPNLTRLQSFMGVDAVTVASPLHELANYQGSESLSELPSLLDMFLGRRAGSIGETCIFALIIGLIYLLYRRVIEATIPVYYIGTVAIFMLLIGKFDLTYLAYQLLAGGLFLGAIFMATDYSTCPLHRKGKIIYAIGCGLLTSLIRVYGSLPEGTSFAIILMNLLVPLIERYTIPKPFGTPKVSRLAKLKQMKKKEA